MRWEYVREFDTKYSVREDGRVWNNETNKEVSAWKDKNGYKIVSLRMKHKTINRRVARLVAEAFIPNPDGLPEVNHIDEDKSNDRICNLEWVTRSQNMTHGTLQKRKGEKLRRPVLRMDPVTGETKRFDSIVIAAKETGIFPTHITDVCKRKPHCNTAGGYKWNYEEV